MITATEVPQQKRRFPVGYSNKKDGCWANFPKAVRESPQAQGSGFFLDIVRQETMGE